MLRERKLIFAHQSHKNIGFIAQPNGADYGCGTEARDISQLLISREWNCIVDAPWKRKQNDLY